MKFSTWNLGLPLLVKELAEQSSRKRTYVVRTVYACLLCCFACVMFNEKFAQRWHDPFLILGHGREMFDMLLALQFAGIYFFMPAITCGVLTQEKERDSLSLLFLTRLGPWAILFEKLLARVVPMLTFLLLSLPLLAFTYSMGGITQAYLWSGIWMLLITVLQVGTLALMCSSFFRTTVSAFIGTMILGTAVFFVPPFLHAVQMLPTDIPLDLFALLAPLSAIFPTPWGGINDHMVWDMFYAPSMFFEFPNSTQFRFVLIRSLPIVMSSVVFLLLSRVFLVRRAFVQTRHALVRFFRWLDGIYARANNNRVTRGVVLVNESTTLPDDQPVAWRETTKKSLGTIRYLARIFVVIEFPVAFLCVLIMQETSDSGLQWTSGIMYLLWGLATLFVSVASTSLISGERSRQTLDVLLTSPLSGEEIIRQKFRGVYRLMAVLAVPLLTLIATEAWWMTEFGKADSLLQRMFGESTPFNLPVYLVGSLATLYVYFQITAWLSFYIGLRVRTQSRAIFTALVALAIWIVGPYLVLVPISSLTAGDSLILNCVALLSPVTVIEIAANDYVDWGEFGSNWLPTLISVSLYSGILLLIRRACLKSANRFLGRAEETPPDISDSAQSTNVRQPLMVPKLVGSDNSENQGVPVANNEI